MRALTVRPQTSDPDPKIEDIPEPEGGPDRIVAEVLDVGVCGTDHEILTKGYGWAPKGSDRLVLGHESLARVVEVGDTVQGWRPGQLAMGVVRRPCDVPCPSCARLQWDYCRSGRYTECGIKEQNGFMTERFATTATYLVPIPDELGRNGVLTEPASVVVKGIKVAFRVQERLSWQACHAWVIGAGPVGLLACAALGLRDVGVVAIDTAPEDSPRVKVAQAMGATYARSGGEGALAKLAKELGPPDLIIEATGVASVVFDSLAVLANDGVACLLGVASPSSMVNVNAGGLDLDIVLGNKLFFGSVNASREDYADAIDTLLRTERRWPGVLSSLITHRVTLDEAPATLRTPPPGVIKAVVELQPA